jgi:hypothetical protein
MRFNLSARLVRCPRRRRSTSLPNAFRSLLAELRASIARDIRRADRIRQCDQADEAEGIDLQAEALNIAPERCWRCRGERDCGVEPCPHCGADAVPF